MIPQEKAKGLVNKYLQVYDGRLPIAKQCALIAVDEIRDNLPLISEIQQYWIDVKKEITNL